MTTFVLASGNAKKLDELNTLLSPLGYDIRPQRDYDVPEADETGLTFVENAIIKARNACHHTGLPAIADDSGLEVDALNGAPGVFSARFAGPDATDQKNNALLVDMLSDVPDMPRTARYHAIIVLMRHEDDPTPLIAQGTWDGEIILAPQGDGGFGYDPHFYIADKQCSAAQLAADEKNRISHRGQAIRALEAQLARYFPRASH